jgi:hypothetical protein
MRSLKILLERLLANWLRPIVDIEGTEPSVLSSSITRPIPVRFSVLTPAVQRALDRSA